LKEESVKYILVESVGKNARYAGPNVPGMLSKEQDVRTQRTTAVLFSFPKKV
jgi:hypothetical protein